MWSSCATIYPRGAGSSVDTTSDRHSFHRPPKIVSHPGHSRMAGPFRPPEPARQTGASSEKGGRRLSGRPCWNFAKGKCSYGDACAYLHDVATARDRDLSSDETRSSEEKRDDADDVTPSRRCCTSCISRSSSSARTRLGRSSRACSSRTDCSRRLAMLNRAGSSGGVPRRPGRTSPTYPTGRS